MTAKTASRLMIVDDDEMTLQALASYLGADYPIACFISGEEAVAAATVEMFPVAILDLRLGKGCSGIEVLKRLKELWPYQQVIIVTGHLSSRSAMDAVNLGAFRYITKPYSFFQLKRIVAEAYQRHEREAALHEDEATPERLELLGLSRREAEVAQGILQRRTNQEIAQQLEISPRTVEKHAERIFSLFEISTRLDLAPKIREAGQRLLRSSASQGEMG